MIVQTSKGNINIPYSASEIAYKEYLPFSKGIEALIAKSEKKEDGFAYIALEDSIEYTVKAVKEYYKNDPEALAVIDQLVFDSENSGLGFGQDVTIMAIYNQIFSLIMGFEPKKTKRFSFKLGGSTYEVQNASVQNFSRYEFNKAVGLPFDFTGGEIGEVLSLRSVMQEQATQLQGQDLLNLIYTGDIKQLAIVCRKRGEQLPSDFAARQEFINKRIQLFKDLDMATILTANFFLSTTITDSLQMKLLAHFSANGKVTESKKVTKLEKVA